MTSRNLSQPGPSASSPLAITPQEAAHPLREQVHNAWQAWLTKSPSRDTRSNYERDLDQFLTFTGVPADQPKQLLAIRPHQVSEWRDHLQNGGLTNSSILRKMTALRSLFSYLQTYGYTGVNPAHGDFVEAPAVPRDGKTVALSPEDCRRLLDAPALKTTREFQDG